MSKSDSSDLTLNAITTLVTTLVIKYLNLDNLLYGPLQIIIFTSIQWIKSLFHNDTNFSNNYTALLYEKSFTIIPLIFMIYILWYFISKNLTDINNFFVRYEEIKIYDHRKIKLIYDYIKFYPEFYKNCNKVCIGHPEMVCTFQYDEDRICGGESIGMMIRPEADEKIYFYDNNFNISGFYSFSVKTVDVKTNDKRKKTNNESESIDLVYYVSCMSINILKSKTNVIEYVDKVIKHTEKKLTDEHKLFHQKIYGGKGIGSLMIDEVLFFDPEKAYNNIDKKIFIDTFFHKQKSELITNIENVHFNPKLFAEYGQIAKIGMLLYGLPGTGKSNFAFRIARYLGRHIVSIDIKSLKKSQVLSNIKRPFINDKECTPKEVIFFFDEFDETIMELYKKHKMREAYYENMKNIEFNVNTNIDPLSLIAMSMQKDSQIKKQNDYDSDSFSDDNSQLSFNDLLELFQGCTPLEGTIFIATTNKYDELMKICPALFRHGRLTSYLFDNFNGKILNEVSEYYFKRSLNLDPNIQPNIMNSIVIDWVIQLSKLENGYDLFKQKIMAYVK
jgi:hypothetical protein